MARPPGMHTSVKHIRAGLPRHSHQPHMRTSARTQPQPQLSPQLIPPPHALPTCLPPHPLLPSRHPMPPRRLSALHRSGLLPPARRGEPRHQTGEHSPDHGAGPAAAAAQNLRLRVQQGALHVRAQEQSRDGACAGADWGWGWGTACRWGGRRRSITAAWVAPAQRLYRLRTEALA